MGKVYVLRNRELVPKQDAAPLDSGPYLIRDELPDTWNPMNGKRYSSRSKYYRDVRAAGGEIVGNDPAGLRERKPVRPDIEPPQRTLRRVMEQLGVK